MSVQLVCIVGHMFLRSPSRAGSKLQKFRLRAWEHGQLRKRTIRPRDQRAAREVTARDSAVVVYLWLIICFLASAPSTVYASIKAVPGLLHFHSTTIWLLNQGVPLLTGFVTSVVLPGIAGLLCKQVSSSINAADLLIVGQLLATPVLPSVVTIVCHAECLGAWVFFWHPCVDFKSSLAASSTV
eukprot:1580811-Amphidinium_carterae.1